MTVLVNKSMQLTCEKCQGVVTYEEADCGKEMSCPHCGCEIKIPAAPIKLPEVPEIQRADIHTAALEKIRGITQYKSLRTLGTTIDTVVFIWSSVLVVISLILVVSSVIDFAHGSALYVMSGLIHLSVAICIFLLAWLSGLVARGAAEMLTLSADVGDLIMWQHVDRRMVQRREIQTAEDAIKKQAHENAKKAAWDALSKDAASVAEDSQQIGKSMAQALRKIAEEFGA